MPKENRYPITVRQSVGCDYRGEDGVRRIINVSRALDAGGESIVRILFKTWWDGDDQEPTLTGLIVSDLAMSNLFGMLKMLADGTQFLCDPPIVIEEHKPSKEEAHEGD